MATNYTSILQDKKNASLKDYALYCARQYTYLSVMWDRPDDEETPTEIKPDIYYLKKEEESKKQLERLISMGNNQFETRAEKSYYSELGQYANQLKEQAELGMKYSRMLHKVRGWRPPTKKHVDLKKFMISQLEDAIKADCTIYDLPEKKSTTEYKQEKIKDAKKDILFHKEQYAQECKRAQEATEWIQELRSSLKKR